MNKQTWANLNVLERLNALELRLSENTADVENVFTQTFLKDAKASLANLPDTPLSGALVSVKDLLDVQGYTTRAGTTFMKNNPPALKDAHAIAKLRAAGAVFVGHTNMTELAYSGLGLNPHYGTPRNALNPDAIPGGSTSGGAISVAQSLADIAIGTDTGGSLRIPAAFNGLVGFKPTQSSVSRAGCKALSPSLDSIGPMARTVSACRAAYVIMSDNANDQTSLSTEFVVPTNFGFDDIEPEIQADFDAAVEVLKDNGYQVEFKALTSLERYKSLAVWHFSAVECRAEYEDSFQAQKDTFDPRVASRMGRADEVSAVSYRQTLSLRKALINDFAVELGDRILLMPTTPIAPPLFSDVASDEDFGRLNLLALRNPSVANVMNGCSISLPWTKGTKPTGVMLTASAHRDLALLDIAAQLEPLLQ